MPTASLLFARMQGWTASCMSAPRPRLHCRGAASRGSHSSRAQVNYVGKAANLYEDAGYKLSGASYVVNKFLGTTWLWDRVRVVGGAYGGFSDFDSHSGKRH